MEKAIIETGAGFSGVCWTGGGLVSLTLPAPTYYEAEMEMGAAVEGLPKKKSPCGRNGGGGIDPGALERELGLYFSGEKVSLSYPVDWSFFTEFQGKVLRRVYSVPWGQLVSYGQVAAEVGNPRGARAVGGAVGANRILLIVPCHRVIAHDGSLGGFGCGLEWKRRLLGLEGISL